MSTNPIPIVSESCSPRGPGLNSYECFVCGLGGGERAPCQMDMAAYVAGKQGGENVVKMFHEAGLLAHLDYRDFEPHYVQVKIGACLLHEPNLKLLWLLTREEKEITPEILTEVSPREPKLVVDVLADIHRQVVEYQNLIHKGLLDQESMTGEDFAEWVTATLETSGYYISPLG